MSAKKVLVLYAGPNSLGSQDFLKTVRGVMPGVQYAQAQTSEQVDTALKLGIYKGFVLGQLDIPIVEDTKKTLTDKLRGKFRAPEKTGLEFIEIAKEMGLPVIFLSNGEKPKYTEKAIKLGARVIRISGEERFRAYLIHANELFNPSED